MLRTLHYYLARDLVKVTLLALVAFTLVLSVFAILEPLRREQGMAPLQVLGLFGANMWIMLSLTLPVAALFAATIVYGRFSQDNELVACRASGISSLSLLRPAIVLGMMVTVGSMYLNNYVAPKMIKETKLALQSNFKGIVLQQLRSQQYLKFGSYVVHADSVADDDRTLFGVVFTDNSKASKTTDTKKVGDNKAPADSKAAADNMPADDGNAPDDVVVTSAAMATIDFKTDTQTGDPYIVATLKEPRVCRVGSRMIMQEEDQPIVFTLDTSVREQPAWYTWDELLATLRDPLRNQDIARAVQKIRQKISNDMFASEMAAALKKPKDSYRLDCVVAGMGSEHYVVKAAKAVQVGGRVVLTGLYARPVEVRHYRNDKLRQTFYCLKAEAKAEYSKFKGGTLVEIAMEGPVTSRLTGEKESRSHKDFKIGEIPLPADVVAKVSKLTAQEVFHRTGAMPLSKEIAEEIKTVQQQSRQKLTNQIMAEMHTRVAYSLSCFLLVVLGSALGLIFRGGQFISAFAISAVPGLAVIIFIFAGRTIMNSGEVGTQRYGLMSIWGGIVCLLIANAYVLYFRLARR